MNNDINLQTKLSKSSFILLVFTGLLMSILFRIDSSSGILYWLSSFIALIIMLSVLVLPLKKLIYPLFILILSMPDVTQSYDQIDAFGYITIASPWQFTIGPLTPAILIFFSLFITLCRLFKRPKKNPYNYIFILFIIITPIISIWFGFFQNSISRFISDAKIPIYFLSGLIIFSSYYKRFPSKLKISCQIFLALAAGSFLLDFLKLFSYNTTNLSSASYNSLSFDSAKGLITIFTFFAIAKIIENKNLFFNLVIVLISLYMIIAYQTRWLIVTFVLGLILVSFLIGIRKTIIKSILLILFISISIPFIVQLNPEIFRIALLRFSFINDLSDSFSLMDIEIVRASAIINSTSLLWENYAFLTGMGYGSWYDDSYFPMLNLSNSAFDNDSLLSGKYYRVHDFFFHFLFKFGIIGTFIYINAFVKPLRKLWKLRTIILSNPLGLKISVIFFGLLPLVVTYMYWTGKGLLFSALFIVLAYEWVKFFKNQLKIENSSKV
jgi:hypothetical protein